MTGWRLLSAGGVGSPLSGVTLRGPRGGRARAPRTSHIILSPAEHNSHQPTPRSPLPAARCRRPPQPASQPRSCLLFDSELAALRPEGIGHTRMDDFTALVVKDCAAGGRVDGGVVAWGGMTWHGARPPYKYYVFTETRGHKS